jgi:hypothetical protein
MMYGAFLHEPQILAFAYDLEQEMHVRVQPQFSGVVSDPPNANLCGSTSVKEFDRPTAFGIKGVMPNPFNPVVMVSYSLPTTQKVKVNVFNIQGQLIATLVNGTKGAGRHSVVWNAKGLSSGLYIVTLESNGKRDSRKVTLMK